MDADLKIEKRELADGGKPVDGSFVVADVEPWGEAVDGDLLLQELARTLRRFVVLPKWGPEALALWVVHTYAYDLRGVSTYVGVESPDGGKDGHEAADTGQLAAQLQEAILEKLRVKSPRVP